MAHSLYCSYSPFLNSSLTDQEDPALTVDAVPRKTLPIESRKPTDQSLATVLSSRRGSLKEFTAKLVREAKQRRLSALPLPVNNDEPSCCEPPSKRRRFERRNSKTAAMLISSLSSINAADFEDESSREISEDPWDGGLEIAEDLVRQLKLRRMSRTCPST